MRFLRSLSACCTPVRKLDSPFFPSLRSFDPGQKNVGRCALVTDSLGKVVCWILENDHRVANCTGKENRRWLSGGVGLISKLVSLLANDDHFIFHQRATANRTSHPQHDPTAWGHPLFLDGALRR